MQVKNILLFFIVMASVCEAHNHYEVHLAVGDAYTISFNCYQKVVDSTDLKRKVKRACLWEFEDYSAEGIVQLSEETYQDTTVRMYDPYAGNRRYSFTNALWSMILMPMLIGFFTLTPYQQDYLFHAINTGITRLTFTCKQRYCWLPAIRVVTIDFIVDEAGTKGTFSSFFSSLTKSKSLYVR